MPLYEYRCLTCEDDFELLVRPGQTPACPSCQGLSLERLLSRFAVSSAERSQASIRKAKIQYQRSSGRQEKLRHESAETREHLQDDYGIDLGRTAAAPKSTE